MGNLRRYYYANKAKIWKTILIIASILLLIQIVNYAQKIKNEQALKNNVSNNTTINTTNQDTVFSNDKSLVNNNTLSEVKLKNEVEIVKQFFYYCNNGEKENAYNLISEECKNEFYKTVSEFEEKYLKKNFSDLGNKIVKIENWANNIYKISIKEDIMATGNVKGESKQDYVTVVTENKENKLNLNEFIGKKEINKTTEQNGINITVINKKTYMEYEEYEIKIENKSDNTILLDTMESTKTIYLLDENGMKYYAQTHEILDGLLKINSGYSKQIKIKFSRAYSSTRAIESLVFSDVILNYKDYSYNEVEREKVTVNF